jgi:hypothetical protein
VAQVVEHLPCKHPDFKPQYRSIHQKKLELHTTHTCNSSTEKVEGEEGCQVETNLDFKIYSLLFGQGVGG